MTTGRAADFMGFPSKGKTNVFDDAVAIAKTERRKGRIIMEPKLVT